MCNRSGLCLKKFLEEDSDISVSDLVPFHCQGYFTISAFVKLANSLRD
jgi:hypothetical protein